MPEGVAVAMHDAWPAVVDVFDFLEGLTRTAVYFASAVLRVPAFTGRYGVVVMLMSTVAGLASAVVGVFR
jgi:hypothetical protein